MDTFNCMVSNIAFEGKELTLFVREVVVKEVSTSYECGVGCGTIENYGIVHTYKIIQIVGADYQDISSNSRIGKKLQNRLDNLFPKDTPICENCGPVLDGEGLAEMLNEVKT